mmetsp:Transcript_130898/g.227582  ORF Transcript_130898/g.227582 Transcript_130898/m.227582 type:complete len:113 (+) Transcript_130898:824-1162(+)
MKARPNSLRQRLTSGSPAGNRELSFEAVDNDFPVDRLAAEGELSTEEKSVGRAEGAAGSVSRKLRPTARRQPFPVPGQPSARSSGGTTKMKRNELQAAGPKSKFLYPFPPSA